MPGVDQQLAALADPSRRAIFEMLILDASSVGELAERLPISRPAVSQHLRVLGEAKLVLHRRDGTRNIYRVNPEGLQTLRNYLDAMWSRALRDFKAAAEATFNKAGKERS